MTNTGTGQSLIRKLPSGWVEGPLYDFIEEKTERNRDKQPLPVFSITNTRGFVPQTDQFNRSIHSKDTSNYKKFRKGYFGFNPSRVNVGSIALNDVIDIGLLSPMYVVFSTKRELEPSYLKHYIETYEFHRNVINGTAGTVRECLKFSAFRNFQFQFPLSSFEQLKIAEVLSNIDKAIQQSEKIILKQQRIKLGLMHDLLTKGIDVSGSLRFEKTHEFKDSPLGRIPFEWDYSNLGSCNVHNNLRKPISALVRENIKGTYPYYGPTGILDYINEYRIDGKFMLIGEDGDHFLKYKTQEMTLLVSGKYNVNNHAHILSGNDKVSTEWLHLFFMHRDITRYLTRQGAGRFKLNKAALLGLPIAYPKSKLEQDAILKIVDYVRLYQEENKKRLLKLKSQKIALMQDLLSGNVRVDCLINSTRENMAPLEENV